MYYKKYVRILLIFIFFTMIFLFVYLKFLNKKNTIVIQEESADITYNSNIIKDVEYSTKDKDGNEYLIKAEEGEIDFSNSNIIFLKNVHAIISLADSEEITILSDFGKYNSENYDTIFSKNVKINYLDNKVTGEYLDFSLVRNSMSITKNVIYNNLKNILKADVVEINIKTKDTKIYMHEQNKKVNIKSKN